MNFSGQIQAKV